MFITSRSLNYNLNSNLCEPIVFAFTTVQYVCLVRTNELNPLIAQREGRNRSSRQFKQSLILWNQIFMYFNLCSSASVIYTMITLVVNKERRWLTEWFQIWEGVHQGWILPPCLFKLYADYITRNTGLEEAQAGIKIARRNLNNLRYADDTTLMAESEEELKSLLMKVKVESEKVGLNLNIQETKIMASGPINSWQIDEGTVETVSDFII